MQSAHFGLRGRQEDFWCSIEAVAVSSIFIQELGFWLLWQLNGPWWRLTYSWYWTWKSLWVSHCIHFHLIFFSKWYDMNFIHFFSGCCAWLCSCLIPVLRTQPFYLRPEYFISPSISPQGLPVYAENLACAHAKATSDVSPVSPRPRRSFDIRVLSFLDLSASDSDWGYSSIYYPSYLRLEFVLWFWAQSAISMILINLIFVLVLHCSNSFTSQELFAIVTLFSRPWKICCSFWRFLNYLLDQVVVEYSLVECKIKPFVYAMVS